MGYRHSGVRRLQAFPMDAPHLSEKRIHGSDNPNQGTPNNPNPDHIAHLHAAHA